MSDNMYYPEKKSSSIPLKQINNNGYTTTTMGMPFKPNTMTQGQDFSSARNSFKHDTHKKQIYSKSAYSNNKNNPVSASQLIESRRIKSIGQSSMKKGLSTGAALSYRSQDRSFRNSTLARVRGGGYTAPKKKGAIENPFKSG